jgi:hypothetical protein
MNEINKDINDFLESTKHDLMYLREEFKKIDRSKNKSIDEFALKFIDKKKKLVRRFSTIVIK